MSDCAAFPATIQARIEKVAKMSKVGTRFAFDDTVEGRDL
jgi:hypothetical protein